VRFNIETPKEFLDTYQGFNMEEKANMCELFFHNMVLPHPYNWNPIPYVGDDKTMAFASWLRNEELRETYLKRYKEEELHNAL